MTPNQKAFLDMLSHSEGTFGQGDNGYNVMVGDTLFDSYADHPRQMVWIASIQKFSSAAGRYQILARNYDAYKTMLDLPDFSPASQDAIALQMLKEAGSLTALLDNNLEAAIDLAAHLWASLPGAGYGQREQKLPALRGWYMTAGGADGTPEEVITA